MAPRGSVLAVNAVQMLGVAATVASLLLVTSATASAPPPASEAAAAAAAASSSAKSAPVTRQRRSDDYDNMDNFLMGSSDYDNFFLKTAKSVPRIGRRSGGDEPDQPSVHVDRRSTDMNELVPSYANGYDHFFLKASKSVPRIGKRNDEFFMKTAKSVPRIGRRSGDPDNFLLKGKDQSDFLKTADQRPRLEAALKSRASSHQLERRSRLRALPQVEDVDWPSVGALGGNDAVLGRPHAHRVQRRNYEEYMAKAAKSVPRMGKRVYPALDEVGDWGTEQQWPWFRQQDASPVPYKRANPADRIDLSEVPWDSLDALVRRLETHRGHGGDADAGGHDVVLLEGDAGDGGAEAKWAYAVADKKDGGAGRPASGAWSGSKELEEARYQPDVKRRK